MTPRPGMAITAVLATLVVACSGDMQEDVAQEPTGTASPVIATQSASPSATPSPSPSPTPTQTPSAPTGTPTTDARQWASCEHPEGIVVEYPQEWHVNAGDVLEPCSAFDPEPLDVPEAQEFFDAGALLSVEPVAFSRIAAPDAQTGDELSRRSQMVDGHDAVRIETEAQGDALLPDGTRSTRWLVVLGREKTLTLSTHETGNADDYESHRDVLDEMVTRLQLPDDG